MIDTHSHIYVEEFADDVDDVVSRAQQAGVEKILLPNINRESIEPMLALCHRYPGYLYPMIGLHPEDVKEDWELDLMRKAQAITDKAFSEVVTRIKVGMTELELQAELIYCLYKNGATGLAFDPIVVAGPNSSLPHGVASERVIQEGDFVTMDFGVLYMGYCSDMTRTVALGFATEEMKEVYNTVLRAQLAGIAATKAGVSGKDVDLAARKVIEEGFGHGLGVEVHEQPGAGAAADVPLPVGAVISAEPGIYLPGKFGVRIEDCVVVEENGCTILTKSPKDLLIL